MLKLPDYVAQFMKSFTDAGYEIFVVGGSVRDLLLKKSVKDWDFATSATPEEILKLYPKGFYNNTFGTVGIEVEDPSTSSGQVHKKHIFEVTTYRHEGEYKDSRRPEDVTWAKTIEEDLARRDFTVNAIAYDGTKLIDPYNGQEDLKKKLIHAVGDANVRFAEDALRLLRAVRIATDLGFTIEENTKKAISTNASLITNIAQERIRDELLRIIASDHPAEGILLTRECGLLTHILPELDRCFDVSQISPKRHHIYDVGTHCVMALRHCPSPDVITRLAALLHDIGKFSTFKKDPDTEIITFYNHEVVGANLAGQIADRLHLSKVQKEKLVMLIRHHMFSVSEEQTDKAVRRFITAVGRENIQDMLAVRTGDRIGSGATPTSWRLDLFIKRLADVQKKPFDLTDLKITGRDVMAELNIKPGPQVGKILNAIFEKVVDDTLKNEKKALLVEVKNLATG